MVVPLTARGVTLRLAALSRAEHPEPYDEADVRLVSDLASRAAAHIDNARLYTREHDAAVTLQRSLLPRHIPAVPGLDIAHRYQPASQAVQAGGDWFDVIALDRGQVALVVGDVTGHSIHAAAIIGRRGNARRGRRRLPGHRHRPARRQRAGPVHRRAGRATRPGHGRRPVPPRPRPGRRPRTIAGRPGRQRTGQPRHPPRDDIAMLLARTAGEPASYGA